MNERERHAAVLRAATAFRAGIERIPSQERGVALGEFPYGSCSDATDLLGVYLADSGLGEFDRVSAERRVATSPGFTTHAWLDGYGLTVDITADQFADVNQAVLCLKDSAWHHTWILTGRAVADFRLNGSFEVDRLAHVYQRAAAYAKTLSCE